MRYKIKEVRATGKYPELDEKYRKYWLFVKSGLFWRRCRYSMRLDEAKEYADMIISGKYSVPDSRLERAWKSIKRTFDACILCIRFPFLYPRNRFSGCHYTNYTIREFSAELYRKYSVFVGRTLTDGPETLPEKKWYSNVRQTENFRQIGRYWTNWWALPCSKIIKFFHDYILQIFHFIPTYTELDAMPNGWRNAFGIDMCKEIRTALLKYGGIKTLYGYRIVQIKEKWGQLCWYDTFNTAEGYRIIDKYESISARTCISCGKPAQYVTNGWISPYCKDCVPKTENSTDIDEYYSSDSDDGRVETELVASGFMPASSIDCAAANQRDLKRS